MTLYKTELPIRTEIVDAQTEVIDRWAKPGTWWSGAERLAIVEEVRAARDGEDLPPWVAPSTVEGLVADGHLLPLAAIDAVWRLTNHPGSLTSEWYDTIVPGGLSAGRYVELVGVVAQANCVDRFADALSLERVSLPEPADGIPSRETPEDTEVRDHWVPTAPVEGFNVLKALSSVPEENTSMRILGGAHYVSGGARGGDIGARHWSLERVQIELLAARTSTLNECFY